MALSNFNMLSLGSFLQTSKYYIPDYQREYSWDKDDQVADFWEDLIALDENRRNDSNETHFFGQVVIQQENDKSYLIDGQQRITTSVIALAAFRDFFEKYKDSIKGAKYVYEDITTKYIGRFDDTDDLDELRFFLGQSDAKFFRDNIQISSPQENGDTPARKRICSAYNYLIAKINTYVEDVSNDIEKVKTAKTLYISLTDNFKLMSLTTDNINEAFIIFETLNARGKELETSDLLKNFFFMQSGHSPVNMNQMKDRWMSMINTLEKKEDTTKLIRYYWNATHKYVHDKKLYKDVSKTVKNYNDSLVIVKDLERIVELYNTLSVQSTNSCYDDDKIFKHIKNLKALRVTTYYPVMIALYLKNISEDQVLKVVSSIEVMAFRNFAIASQNPNSIERKLAEVALNFYQNKITIDELIEQVKKITVADRDLDSILDNYKPSNNKLAKFILREVESSLANSNETKLNESDTVINLEHIMPQDNSIWGYPQEEHDEVVNMIGNMTLLAEKWNKSISNKSFDDKKLKYELSAIKLTKALSDYQVWNKDSILERNKIIKEKILKIWAL